MQPILQTQRVAAKTFPAPIAPELFKFIGGGATAPQTTPTPQAPRNRW